MATIRTAIELQDNFTGVLYQVINSVNMGLSAMEDLHQTMNNPVDTTSIEAARDSINQATIAVQQLDAAMQGMETPTTESPTAPQSSAPVRLPVEPVVPDPLVDQPEPVQVPIHWQSDNVEVFTGSGVERFQQEVQSANQMLEQLSTKQNAIARQAYNTNILPPQAFQDLNRLAVRVDNVRERIQQIENNPMNIGTNVANAELEQLRGQLDQAIQEQQNLNRAVDNMDVQAANEAYLRLSHTIGGTERYIRDNVDEQGRFNQEINEGVSNAENLVDAIKGIVAAYATIQTVGKVIELSDTMTQTTARLDLIVDDGGSVEELQNKIFASAQASRGSYLATADAVSKLGLMAGDAFNSSEEIIAFMEQVNKQFRIAGTEAAGIDAAMLQLTQAMGSGILRGEEYNSILEQAPNIIQAIADYMEVPKGQLKDMAAEGQITADIVKAAMFAAAEETNAKFESMPKTFEQIGQSIQNTALMAFQPVLERLNELANSEAFQNFVNGAIEALSMVAEITLEIFTLVAEVGAFIGENWSVIEPIIMGIVTALGLYYGAMLLYNAITGISAGITAAKAFAEQIHAASLMMQTGATFAATAAQYGFNAALLACPLTWIFIAILALITVIYTAVAAYNKFTNSTVSGTGIIVGVITAGAAFVGNLFIALINLIIDVVGVIWNFIASFAEFFANVFVDPIGAIVRLFANMADTVLSILEGIASAIDTIFGSGLSDAVSGWRTSLSDAVDAKFGAPQIEIPRIDSSAMHLERFNYTDAFRSGYENGVKLDKTVSAFLNGDKSKYIPDPNDYSIDPDIYNATSAAIPKNISDIADNTAAIKDAIDITNEELKYLRDLAVRDAINRFTTANIEVNQTNHNTINSNFDLDGITAHLHNEIKDALDIAMEGVG